MSLDFALKRLQSMSWNYVNYSDGWKIEVLVKETPVKGPTI